MQAPCPLHGPAGGRSPLPTASSTARECGTRGTPPAMTAPPPSAAVTTDWPPMPAGSRPGPSPAPTPVRPRGSPVISSASAAPRPVIRATSARCSGRTVIFAARPKKGRRETRPRRVTAPPGTHPPRTCCRQARGGYIDHDAMYFQFRLRKYVENPCAQAFGVATVTSAAAGAAAVARGSRPWWPRRRRACLWSGQVGAVRAGVDGS